jgi:hypothetical protein
VKGRCGEKSYICPEKEVGKDDRSKRQRKVLRRVKK